MGITRNCLASWELTVVSVLLSRFDVHCSSIVRFHFSSCGLCMAWTYVNGSLLMQVGAWAYIMFISAFVDIVTWHLVMRFLSGGWHDCFVMAAIEWAFSYWQHRCRSWIMVSLDTCCASSSSAKNYSVRAEWLHQSGRGLSELSETRRWRLIPRRASIPCVVLHIALPLLFHRFFSLCRSPISNEHSGIDGQLWPYVGMGWLGTRLNRDCNAIGDSVKTSPCVPSICPQNAILSLLNIHIIPSRPMYVDIDYPSLVSSVSCLTTSSYRWNYVTAADDVSHT